METTADLTLAIDARIPLIALETHDEPAALQLLTRVAMQHGLDFFCWSITEGLCRLGFGQNFTTGEPESPTDVLRLIRRNRKPTLYALCDYHPYLEQQPEHIRLLREIAMHSEVRHTVALISHALKLPPELTYYSAQLTLALPGDAQRLAIIREEAAAWARERPGVKLQSDPAVLRKLVSNLRGLDEAAVRRLARTAIRDDGIIDESDLPEVNRAKFQLLDMEGVLHFEHDTARFSAVGGMNRFKRWIERRASAFAGRGKDQPKGVLLLGVQGSGKSLAAKAVAGLWGVPLLRLDMAGLYNKYIGETERNLRRALAQAELMSPCVLWIDEIEKGIGQQQSDEGTSRRVLGSLLTWLSERAGGVFVAATANDVSRLPPELLRKGRFDEIFFVDLPDEASRREIFAIHLRARYLDPAQFDLDQLAAASADFSGAEIEQAIVAARYHSAAERQPLETAHLLHELSATFPLAVTMAEPIADLRAWAIDRAVPAD
ncbi:MAG: AAA family ATPase [Spongiibacteraceae bacterium]|jgi:hypothetical protein|nr:AAA family ATPase [Spongiibacteraceae bacterium]